MKQEMEDNEIPNKGLLNVERFEDITSQTFIHEREVWANDFIACLDIADIPENVELRSMLYDAFATGFTRGYDVALLHKKDKNLPALTPKEIF